MWNLWHSSCPLHFYPIHIVKVKVAQSCPTLCSPMNYTVHGILQARILEWVAFPFSRGSSQPRNWSRVSCITGGFFTNWVFREAHTYCKVAHFYMLSSSANRLTWVTWWPAQDHLSSRKSWRLSVPSLFPTLSLHPHPASLHVTVFLSLFLVNDHIKWLILTSVFSLPSIFHLFPIISGNIFCVILRKHFQF